MTAAGTGAGTGSDGGRVVRVAGPLVEVEGLGGVAMSDVLTLGDAGVPGEVVAIADGLVTAQAYEDTGGLAPGSRVQPRGMPLSARLGPGLLGGVFDGLLRPLSGAPTWLAPGTGGGGTTPGQWSFAPAAEQGTEVRSGDVVGTVPTDGPLKLRVLVPPGVSGVLAQVAPAGTYDADAVVATVRTPHGAHDLRLTTTWPVRRPRPYAERLDAAEALHTGQRVLDLLFPVARGSTAAVPGGFGTGKTVLLQQLAKWCDADVIVYVGCGERGNEMADVVDELGALADPRTGDPLARRTVVVANTSNMPMMAREASIYTGVTVAEYFRDMGYDVVVIADSTSRWAEAMREFASRTGALPAEEGYPAGLASALAAFYERAGRVVTLGLRRGSVTVVGAVSPQGGDLTEPVTAHTQRFVRCLWTLDRDLAYARRYPAVSWSASFSRDAEPLGSWHTRAGDPGWARRRTRVVGLLADADRLAALAELVGVTAMPDHERVAMLAGRLLGEAVLSQSSLSVNDAYCSAAKGAALVDAVLAVADRCGELVDAGVPAERVEAADFGPLVRAREDTAADDADGVRERGAAMLDRLEGLR